ncbi:MAG: PDDEXK nuclease domain-containing protein [Duncaniella sp.]|uniref:PDDEXK nuclease domain-containing protein n=1 Tax=Duncaniella sp. TaxID=2518496 RepID=UPI0023C859BB|nr:PDDEXK nuclease domain-containing protein [Duncaniella sp.]MDE5987761.1 PDDEXK nuclease domain-containing protein [Duncaniella sp.]
MADISTNNAPHIVRVKDFKIDTDYVAWLSEIKQRYHSAQIKAAVKVNTEKLAFNWSVGCDLVIRKAEEKWGSGVVEQLSFDLRDAFPNEKGFGTTNLWAMKKWYLFFSSPDAVEKLHQLGGELQNSNIERFIKLRQVGGEIEPDFPLVLGLVPWRHQVNIITKCKSIDEAVFYLRECILGGWSRQTLDNSLKANLYKVQGKAISNFPEYLPEAQSRMAQEITKDNYDFGFVTVPVNYKEEQLEAALEQNITRFLLELGTGFAFVGRQKELIVGNRSRKIDMLFYHIRLKAYVVVELKVKAFDPEYAGKLNYYVNAVDELLKGPDDNPTIGLLICSDKDETDVRWAFKGIQTPMGVASYDNVRISTSNLLPSAEELQARVRLVEEEINKSNN